MLVGKKIVMSWVSGCEKKRLRAQLDGKVWDQEETKIPVYSKLTVIFTISRAACKRVWGM